MSLAAGCPISTKFATVVGVTTIAFFVLRFAQFFWLYFFRPAPSFKSYGSNAGKWALVTGASKGIGAEFSRSLAKRGFNVAMVARSKHTLEEVVDSIVSKYPKCETLLIVVDASAPDAVAVIVEAVRNVELSILVNNVGIAEDIPSDLTDTDDQLIRRLIDVNIVFTTILTKALIPKLKLDRKFRSAIINLSSISALVPTALHAVYAGTKSYINHWTKCLSGELAPHNIDVLSSTPGYVQTDMSGFKRTSFFVISPEQASEDTLNKLGSGVMSITPSFSHSLIALACQLLPDAFLAKSTRQKMMMARQKLLAKKSK